MSLSRWSGIYVVTDPLWGDNGKGKIVDVLAGRADLVVRINGGPNAGHTVINKKGTFKFHLIPSGIFYPGTLCVLSHSVVVDPFSLIEEMETIRHTGISLTPKRFLIAHDAHLIMPWHKIRDQLSEISRGSEKIGTTGRGIGPAYADRTERTGLRVGDLYEKNFPEMFEREFLWQEKLIRLMSGKQTKDTLMNRETLLKRLKTAREILRPIVTDVTQIIHSYHEKRKRILGEAGQGVLLDLDLGTYPYVTSSHPGIAGFNLATGISHKSVNHIVGVTKAYSTRVGDGPMPTELLDNPGERIRQTGHEYGTTTGRPRRCGWLDIPLLRYGIEAGGVDMLAITKIDVFDEFKTIKICVGYKQDKKIYKKSPGAAVNFLSHVTPVYEKITGWLSDTKKVRTYAGLPREAKSFIKRIETLTGVPVRIISVGPSRKATIFH